MLNESTGIWRLQFNSFKLISAVQYGENTTIEILDYTMNTNLGVADKSKISLEHQAADLVLSNKRGKLMGKDYMELDNVENSSNINGF